MKRTFLIYGAGGHARVVADAIQSGGDEVAAFIDDHPAAETIGNINVRTYEPESDIEALILIGIGNNAAREKIAASVVHQAGIVIHPRATIAGGVQIGSGTVILANAVVQTGAVIGKHVIVNANVCIDHDAVIEDYAHIYPNSYIGGGAMIKAGVTVGAGTIVSREMIVEADTKK
jgi:sugar O-acyltransferase (sialic acid O-acetyltransferase NeuD family)